MEETFVKTKSIPTFFRLLSGRVDSIFSRFYIQFILPLNFEQNFVKGKYHGRNVLRFLERKSVANDAFLCQTKQFLTSKIAQ